MSSFLLLASLLASSLTAAEIDQAAAADPYGNMCVDKPTSTERYACLYERQQSVFDWEGSAFEVYDEYSRVIALAEEEREEYLTAKEGAPLAKAYFERAQLGMWLVFENMDVRYLDGIVPDFERAFALNPASMTTVLWLHYTKAIFAKHRGADTSTLAFAACVEPPINIADVCGDFYVSPAE